MSASVPVISYPTNLFHDEKELDRFLLACQEKYRGKNRSPIVSFAQRIETVDPLAILEAIAAPDELHFYWENPAKEEAILGYGTVEALNFESSDRFFQAQKFTQDCFKRTIRTGNLELPKSSPHVFCSFTFFDSPKNEDAPFPSGTIFLPRIQISRQKKDCVLVINLAIHERINIKVFLQQIKHQIQALNHSHPNFLNLAFKNYLETEPGISSQVHHSNHFKSAVNSALQSIQVHQFSKIVIAHALDVISPTPFRVFASLNNLRQRHPDCYIFSTSNGKGKTFIGASPERLLSIQKHQLVTDALAGSAPRGKTASEDTYFAQKLLKSEKERREHQAVIEFIMQRLNQLELKPQRSPLKLLQLSNIQHLWTPIYAQIPSHVHPLEIVAQLHPTPAVAGVPTQIACEKIWHYENFDRSLYAAPLGWIDYQENGEFIVGIRSALIEGNQARLYAGAGIVEGSDPDKEFAEVQLKLQSLLKALV